MPAPKFGAETGWETKKHCRLSFSLLFSTFYARKLGKFGEIRKKLEKLGTGTGRGNNLKENGNSDRTRVAK